jgi:ATP-dependent Lon protease
LDREAERQTVETLAFDVPATVPLLPLRSTVLFPLQVASVQVASKTNLTLLEDHPSMEEVVAAGVLVDPEGSFARRNLGSVAVACKVLSRVKMPDGTVQVVLQGLRRVRIARIVASRPYLQAEAAPLAEPAADSPEVRDLVADVIRLIGQLVEVDEGYPDELLKVVQLNLQRGSRCADFVADRVKFSYADKRRVLETADVSSRLALVAELLRRQLARARVADEVQAKTAVRIERSQRKALLRAQLEVIRRELDELDPAEAEIALLEQKVQAAALPPIVAEETLREVQRLRQASARALEGSSIRAHVEWVLSLPWTKTTKDRLDLRRARHLLDDRYFAFEDAKRRLLEFLAVRKLGGGTRSSLLAIVGPPGTGRTRLARTVADILGRSFVRISVRGIHDEAELRGLRRTSMAARPSLFLEGLREAGTRNPVILVDDIDLLESDEDEAFAALAEALDPARHHRFQDQYLGFPFDLSQALFVITAHLDESLPESLADRTTVVELPGYTELEKLAIARKYVWPQVMREHGIQKRGVSLTKAALRQIIRKYTREAGVYELREQLEKVCRRIAVREASRGHRRLSIHVRNLHDYLGAPVYTEDPVAREPQLGAAMGLAWTEEGGDLLPIEALLMPGEGRRTLTGLLGEVMQESVAAALSYVRSRAAELEIPADAFEKNDIHVHFPEGAIAKDGPSAGITVATTIASLLSGRPVRHDVAMTGEISLRGRVLPVGSVREKVLAAYRAGIKHVILPKANERDLEEIPGEVRAKLRFHLVTEVDEVFRIALGKARRPAARTPPPRRKKPRGKRRPAK